MSAPQPSTASVDDTSPGPYVEGAPGQGPLQATGLFTEPDQPPLMRVEGGRLVLGTLQQAAEAAGAARGGAAGDGSGRQVLPALAATGDGGQGAVAAPTGEPAAAGSGVGCCSGGSMAMRGGAEALEVATGAGLTAVPPAPAGEELGL
jgi:hypothetical protein